MAFPTATLGGLTLDLTGPVGWTYRHGTQPHVQPVHFSRRDLAVKAEGLGHDTYLDLGEGERIQHLAVIGPAPSVRPINGAVLVADRRWWWSRCHLVLRANVRRRTGETRRVGGGPVQTQTTAADVTYEPATLDDGAPYRAERVVEELLAQVKDQTGVEMPLRWELPRRVVVEGLEIDDDGPSAFRRVLGHLPGASMWVDADGTLVVGDLLSGEDVDVVNRLGPPSGGSTHIRRLDLSRQRPRRIYVYFSTEIEVRFDANISGGVSTTRTDDRSRSMVNVAPVPDPELTVNGRTVTEGTWLPFSDLLTAWAADWPTGTEPPTDALIRKLFCSPALLGTYWVARDGTVNQTVARRVGVILQHYRQTFRLNAEWRNRIRSFKPHRVSGTDVETGQLARSPVYANHARAPSLRRLILSSDAQLGDYAVNVTSYDDDTESADPAPIVVDVVDQQAGIIRLVPKTDPDGYAERIIVSKVNNPPNADPKFSRYTFEFCELSASFDAATILTVVPSSPNDYSQLHEEPIDPGDVGGLIAGLGSCTGPEAYVRVSAGLETARFAWDDQLATQIQRAVFSGGTQVLGDPVNGTPGAPPDSPRGSLPAVARAAAASYWAQLRDRYEGVQTSPWVAGLRPLGSVEAVSYTIDQQGARSTTVSTRPVPPPVDILSLIPEGTRRILLRQVQPE